MGCPMLDPIQNNVVFLTFFIRYLLRVKQKASNRLKGTGSILFSLTGRVYKRNLKKLAYLQHLIKCGNIFQSNINFHRQFSEVPYPF